MTTANTAVTMSTGDKVLQLLRAIFGMQPNGNLAGNYREAFVRNVLLMIPFGYLVLLHFLCGETKTSVLPAGKDMKDKSAFVAINNREKRNTGKSATGTIHEYSGAPEVPVR